MTASPNPENEASAPAEAFASLANETRVRILRTLGESGERNPVEMPYKPFDTDDPEGLPYAELRARADVDDSGRFNYHLGELVGRFVQKSGDTYRLSWLGILAFRFVVAGVLHEQATMERFETDSPCGHCGTRLEASYPADGLCFLDCPDCGYRAVGTDLPPHAVRNRSREELLRVLDRRERGQISLLRDGICYWCSGQVDAAVHATPGVVEGVRRTQPVVTLLCQDCGGLRFPSVGTVVATDPRVTAFLVEHTDDSSERYLWEWPFVAEADAVTVRSTDPFAVTVRVAGGDSEALVVSVDESAQVTSVERR